MKRVSKNKKSLSAFWTIVLYVLISLAILAVTVYLQPGSAVNTLKNFLRDPRLLALNLLPILAVLGLLYALLGNLFFAGSATGLIFHALSLVNLIKVECRKDPLVPPDFGLLGEAIQATGEYRLDLHPGRIALFAVFALVLFLLGLRFKSRPKAWKRLVSGLLCALCMAGAMMTVYPSKDLYMDMIGKIDGLSYTNVPRVFDETGFVYCFLHNFGLYEVEKPAGYDKAEAAAWASETAASAQTPVKANVIFVQCEAYSDLYDNPVFTYAPEDNPMYLFHRVAESPRALSGRIVVSNFGAGTANTEFDVLTGMQTNMLNSTPTSALRVVHKNVSTLARTFRRQGYDSWFMHPGERWFYNRESVYHYFGLDNQTFREDFSQLSYKGSWPSDDCFRQELIRYYEARDPAVPWFAFTVTVQNHQAYPWSKYDFRVPDVQISVPLSDAGLENLSVYAEGIRDSSKLLWDLTQYFDAEQAPTILVFWGDHLPAMGANFGAYREAGLPIGDETQLQSALDTYSTPYVIWANEAFDRAYGFQSRVDSLDMGAGDQISDIYLGELVYELLDMEGSDAYFDYLGQARRTLSVLCMGRYALPDGTLTDTLTPEQQAVEDKLHKWTYYRVIDERVTE